MCKYFFRKTNILFLSLIIMAPTFIFKINCRDNLKLVFRRWFKYVILRNDELLGVIIPQYGRQQGLNIFYV